MKKKVRIAKKASEWWSISQQLETREINYSEILFYNHQIYTNFKSLMIPCVREDTVLKIKQPKKAFSSRTTFPLFFWFLIPSSTKLEMTRQCVTFFPNSLWNSISKSFCSSKIEIDWLQRTKRKKERLLRGLQEVSEQKMWHLEWLV